MAKISQKQRIAVAMLHLVTRTLRPVGTVAESPFVLPNRHGTEDLYHKSYTKGLGSRGCYANVTINWFRRCFQADRTASWSPMVEGTVAQTQTGSDFPSRMSYMLQHRFAWICAFKISWVAVAWEASMH